MFRCEGKGRPATCRAGIAPAISNLGGGGGRCLITSCHAPKNSAVVLRARLVCCEVEDILLPVGSNSELSRP
jgi:hypothetical protein